MKTNYDKDRRGDDSPRLVLIAHIREQIESGRYVTDGKLRRVAECLLDELDTHIDDG